MSRPKNLELEGILLIKGSEMNAAGDTEKHLGTVPLLNAVFCVDCETISNSPHDACAVCGSRSLINLFRIVGGTLRSQKVESAGDQAQPAGPAQRACLLPRARRCQKQPGATLIKKGKLLER